MLHQTPEIPNYTIISPLGSGATGHVWLAKDIYGERRAIKVTHFDYLNVPDYQRRFKREVAAQQQLYRVSSHVARIFYYDEKYKPPYIVMDYINGTDLNRLIATKEIAAFDLMTRLHWIEALASTLTKAHSMRIPGDTHGIIHRDIKPQNIRIQGERPYLLDFSISLTSDVAVDSTQDAMTLRYAAPELTASESSDIFSFGLVAFEILYERHPLTSFDEATTVPVADYTQYVLNKLITGTWTLPHQVIAKFPVMNKPETQEALNKVFQKVLAIAPSVRYKTAKAFSDDLSSVLLGGTSNSAFQVYASRLTTDNPPIEGADAEYKLPEEIVHNTPEETRQFYDGEIVLPPQHSLQEVGEPLTDTNEEISQEALLISDVPNTSIANKRHLPILSLLATCALSLIFVALFMTNRNNLTAVVTLTTSSPTVITLSPESQDGRQISVVQTDRTSTLTFTATQTLSRTPKPSATFPATVTPKPSSTSTLTSTKLPTASPTYTLTFTLTATLTETASPTATLTRTPKPSATHTLTATSTLIPSSTATFTLSPTPIPPSSTPIPTPEDWSIEQYVFTVNSIMSSIPVVFMPRGCIIASSGEELCLEEGVWIDLETVSNDKYDLCSRIGACSRPAFGELFDPAGARSNNPIVGVSQIMANQYCLWRNARLPSKTEWQILVKTLPTAYRNIDEWTDDLNSPDGQSQMMTIIDGIINKIWLEDSYLSDDLSFRCVQFK